MKSNLRIMKSLFSKKEEIAKTVRVEPPKSKINLPFSQSENAGENDDNGAKSSENKKTRIGRQPDMPFTSKSGNDNLACPRCQYPLRIEPSGSSPCPNCGFNGDDTSHDTVSDSKKTIVLSELNLKDEERLSEFRFKLISEASGSELKIEPGENETVLSREFLDPNNTSISSKEHLLVKFRNGKIFIQDVSTNGLTFIQVIKKTSIVAGTRIVMGNRIFLFSTGNPMEDPDNSKATRQIGKVSLDTESNNYVLIEEGSGRKIDLSRGVNLLNRNNLDPGNTSISGSRHAELEFSNEQWFLSDLSSNAATFIQCKTEQQITNKVRIIIGNIIFRFEYD
jgi:hypothetical protein